jgi:hypothetical protein
VIGCSADASGEHVGVLFFFLFSSGHDPGWSMCWAASWSAVRTLQQQVEAETAT